MTDPARFNRRLALEGPVEVSDGAGGVIRTYQQIVSLWAEITPVTSQGIVDADRLGVRVTHRIVIRAPRTLSTRHRLADGARHYRIVSFRETDDRRLIEIQAEEMVG
jgi:SPP1 family predicted phage head-tail adaptor